MTALNTLKAQLQPFVNKEGLDENFKAAISDGIYACELGSWQALNQWIVSWTEIDPMNFQYMDEDKHYLEGVRFVEQQWEAVTGMF